ncbi:MAG: nucleotidyltransferase family protein [Anaerolineae bacterium]|nr:nucleotidyltransferase family protein [Anaerolineae bacterium]
MINRNFDWPMEQIRAFCERWKITELSVFGSVLRDDFRPDSDIDLLVSFAPHAGWSLFDLAHMEEELEQMLGRDVDLVTRRGLERSRNYLRKAAIFGSEEPVYVAG